MGKPTPKAEIVIEVQEDIKRLVIYCGSEDAHAWVQGHAPLYGGMLTLSTQPCYLLHVSPLYDINEVAEYLRLMQD